MEKIAVIDMGSNLAKLILAYVLEDGHNDGHFVVFDELQETVRLGQDMERDGYIKPSPVKDECKRCEYGNICGFAFSDGSERSHGSNKSFENYGYFREAGNERKDVE